MSHKLHPHPASACPVMENRGRGRGLGAPRKPHSKNRQWVAGHENGGGPSSDSDRWERGGHRRGRGRGRGYHSHPTHLSVSEHHDDGLSGTEDEEQDTMDEGVEDVVVDKEPESQEDRDKFFKEVRRHVITTE